MVWCKGLGMDGGIKNALKSLIDNSRLGDLLVLKGQIDQQQLQYALARQQSGDRLGRILLEQRLISRRALYKTLGQQWTLRCMAGAISFVIAFSCADIRSARAEQVRDIPAQMRLASAANAAFAPMRDYAALFGSEEKASANLSPFTKWTEMFVRYERAMNTAEGGSIVRGWQNDLRGMQGLSLREMAQRVNDLANAQPYINDSRNWGKSDYWETPLEFFTKGGDCEDFAIAKYASLRALGVPEERLRITILQDLEKNIPHAVLAVYTDDDVLILDNQIKKVRSSASISHYKPIFSINRKAWWLHSAPTATVIAAR